MIYTAPEKSSIVEPLPVNFSVKSLSIKRWESLSFTSTLYLRPILDALLESTPNPLHDELRLGLQEALVNAAKHGNHLDPQKVVSVRHTKANGYYWWIVTDQGEGFERPANCGCPLAEITEATEATEIDEALSGNASVSEGGRGLYILHQVFDQVRWSENGKAVHLAKQLDSAPLTRFIRVNLVVKMIESGWQRWSSMLAHSS